MINLICFFSVCCENLYIVLITETVVNTGCRSLNPCKNVLSKNGEKMALDVPQSTLLASRCVLAKTPVTPTAFLPGATPLTTVFHPSPAWSALQMETSLTSLCQLTIWLILFCDQGKSLLFCAASFILFSLLCFLVVFPSPHWLFLPSS